MRTKALRQPRRESLKVNLEQRDRAGGHTEGLRGLGGHIVYGAKPTCS
jgi:hypothetical protein